MHGNPDGEAGIQIRLNEFQRMFESNGIKVNVVIDHSIRGHGQVDPPGLDGIPTVRVAKDGFADTIPHEFAHIYLDLLGLDNPAVQEALEEIQHKTSQFNWVLDHVDRYYPEYNGDMYDKEVLATAMGMEYLRQEKLLPKRVLKKKKLTYEQESPNWFQRIINAFADFWKSMGESVDESADSFDKTMGNLAYYGDKVETLTKDMFTGNLRTEEFVGVFNSVLQESRD